MKKLFAGILFSAVMGYTATASAGVFTLDGANNFTLDGGPGLDAIIAPLMYNGTTVGGPVFNRPLANGTSAPTSLSGVGTAVPFDSVMFTVATTGTYSFLSTSTTTGYDNFTVLYQGAFNPASPLTGALIANDDLTSTTTSGFSKALTAGTTYTFVTTGFSNTSAGTFTDSITLTAVPEPGTWAMMGAGLAGLLVVQRLRRRTA